MRRQKVLTALAQKAVLPVAGANVLRWLRKQRGLGIVDGDDSPEIVALANTEREAKAVIWSTWLRYAVNPFQIEFGNTLSIFRGGKGLNEHLFW